MAINFPDNPSTNDTYTVNGRTYIWNGEKWLRAQPELTSVVPTLTVSNALTVDTSTLHVDSTNNRVGVGTASPAAYLHVFADLAAEGIRLQYNDGDVQEGAYQSFYDYAGTRIGFVGYPGTGSLYLKNETSTGKLVLSTNNTDRLTIDSSGNVGIGTTGPAKKLHVKGDNEGIRIEDGSSTDHYDIYRNDTTGFLEFTGSQTSFSGYDFEVNNGTNVVRIANSGNVGIGTTSPAAPLHVGTGHLRIDDTASDTKLVMTTLGQQDWSIGIDYSDSGKLKFSESTDVGTTTRMTIDSSGNVGIGTTDPQVPLHVQRGTGITAANYSGDFAALIYHAANASTKHGLLVANQWIADASTLIEAGNIYATNAAYTKMFYVTGYGRSYNYYGTWGTISDQTLKTEIVDANSQLQDILDLRFVNYKFIKDIERDPDTAPRLFGLLAQEVEQVSPGLINEDAEGFKTINTSVLSMKAVKAMQEMHAIVETQQATIDVLTARIEALEAN